MKPSRPRFQLRELLLLLVPVLALAGFGAYFVLHPSASPNGEWVIVVDDVKVEPATSREVALGYDTRVVFHAKETGNAPTRKTGVMISTELAPIYLWAKRKGQRVNLSKNVPAAQRLNLQSTLDFNYENGTRVVIPMKLADVPIAVGAVDLETGLEVKRRWDDASGIHEFEVQSSPVVVTVRRAGEKIKKPIVSKYRPFVLKKFAIDNKHPYFYSGPGDRVVLEVQYGEDTTNRNPQPSLRSEEISLIDAKGRKYQWLKQPSGAMLNAANLMVPIEEHKDGVYRLFFNVATSQIPASAGKLTLHTRVSMDDCWPLDLSLVVREK